MRDCVSQYRLWRKSGARYYQILGAKDVARPPTAPLQIPKACLNARQKKTIVAWYWGENSNYSKPINSLAAVCA